MCGDADGYVRPLLRALYGHVEAPKLWNQEWAVFMVELGFMRSQRDSCLWIKPDKSIILVLCGDDSLIAARTMRTMSKLLSALKTKFKIHEMGEPR